MTPKLTALSGFRNLVHHAPVQFFLSDLARLQILTPIPTAEKSPKRPLPALPLRPGGVEPRTGEQSALRPRSRRTAEREGPEGPGSARRGAQGSQPLSLLQSPAPAGESRDQRQPEPRGLGSGRLRAREGVGPRFPVLCATS